MIDYITLAILSANPFVIIVGLLVLALIGLVLHLDGREDAELESNLSMRLAEVACRMDLMEMELRALRGRVNRDTITGRFTRAAE